MPPSPVREDRPEAIWRPEALRHTSGSGRTRLAGHQPATKRRDPASHMFLPTPGFITGAARSPSRSRQTPQIDATWITTRLCVIRGTVSTVDREP